MTWDNILDFIIGFTLAPLLVIWMFVVFGVAVYVLVYLGHRLGPKD